MVPVFINLNFIVFPSLPILTNRPLIWAHKCDIGRKLS